MDSVYNIALGSLRAAATRLNTSAHNVANVNTEEFRPHKVVQGDQASGGVTARSYRQDQPDQVDLSEEALEQIKGETAFRASLELIRSEEERTGEIVDLIA